MTQMLFRVKREEFGQEGAEIYIALRHTDGRLGIVQPMTVTIKTPEGADCCSSVSSPAIRLENFSDLQGLMDQLWEVGVRPSDIGAPGHLAAIQAHLSDMRKLVQKSLDVQL